MLDAIPELGRIFDIGKVIGEGTFSTVYEACLKHELRTRRVPYKYAVKYITPIVEPSVQANELKFLTMLDGKNNVVKNVFASRNSDNVALVMPYHKHVKFSRLIKKLDVADVRHYMRNLLIALSFTHSHGIIHRDIKPNNFLYCMKSKKGVLVDFGLAQLQADANNDDESISQSVTLKLDITSKCNTPLKDSTNQQLGTNGAPAHLNNRKRKFPSSENETHNGTCNCKGRTQVCRRCLAAPGISAARAGTAGYRPPEVNSYIICDH